MHNPYLNRLFVVFIMIGLAGGGLMYSASPDLAQILEDVTPHPTLTLPPVQKPLPKQPETLFDIQTLLLKPDKACQLPCFWEVRPGYTTEETIMGFLQPVAVGNNAPELNYVFRKLPKQEPIFYISFGIKEGVVSTISVILDNPSEWLPSQTLELPYLLSLVPSTPSAYLSINITTRRVFLTLAYEKGVIAEYAFELHSVGETLTKADFQFCPVLEQTYNIQLILNNNDIDSILEEWGVSHFVSRNKLWSVEHMTGMAVKQFIEQIIEKPDECIDLPSYRELLALGYEF